MSAVHGPIPFYCSQLDLYLRVVQRCETLKIESAVADGLGEPTTVRGLLPAEADGLQF